MPVAGGYQGYPLHPFCALMSDPNAVTPHSAYTGRFAPSPSGPLHFGSLIAAVASYCDARAQHGRWLVRMEDVDSPRCVPHADQWILDALVAHGLHWDGPVWYQSARDTAYQQVIEQLQAAGRIYYCTCTRKMIRQQGGHYPGTCRGQQRPLDDAAIRLHIDTPVTHFDDRLLGLINASAEHPVEDFIIRRKDGLYAYNLAVVVDDIAQQVSHIVRGSDLVDTTVAQLSLYQLLGAPAPSYAHVPVAATAPGFKLSKQNKATRLDVHRASTNLVAALAFLNLRVPTALQRTSCDKILAWAVAHWDIRALPQRREIIVADHESPYHS